MLMQWRKISCPTTHHHPPILSEINKNMGIFQYNVVKTMKTVDFLKEKNVLPPFCPLVRATWLRHCVNNVNQTSSSSLNIPSLVFNVDNHIDFHHLQEKYKWTLLGKGKLI